ncbi:DNA polymerase III [Erysipelothrix larvae]|uniref:DNA polymerase III PolC-type n=1 Tax=Erysipelothrix larvae TaxID=1514105 RepID=A0A0X8GZN4_9FIRM|nr:PolC-type DNA polymerase III [Erysipelothrix larvae]AMC93320.1 DNA polymerase III [Erysipelothrix larvae]
MKSVFNKLNLDSEILSQLDDVAITSSTYIQEEKRVEVELESHIILPYTVFYALRKAFITSLRMPTSIKINTSASEIAFKDLMDYVDFFVQQSRIRELRGIPFNVENDEIIFLSKDEATTREIRKGFELLSSRLSEVGIKREMEVKTIRESNELEVIVRNEAPIKPVREQDASSDLKRVPRQNVKITDYQPIKLRALTEDANNIVVEGHIFEVEIFQLKSGDFSVKYFVEDGEAAIIIGEYYKSEDDILKKGTFARFYGNYIYDNKPYVQDYIFKMKRFTLIDSIFKRDDTSDKKRVEFHLHTTISEMDGVSDVSEYIKQAHEWGHPGLVITDHEGVQSFPKAYNAARALKKKNPDQPFKVGYGVEMNLADKNLTIAKNPKGQSLHDTTYIIFDLETTGLSSYYDHIIEFGAVKVVNGQTVDKMQMFIKPPISIRPTIQALTNITDNDVRNAPTIEQAIHTMLKFIGDGVLVAHNATFDYDFIQETLRRLGMPPIDNSCVDSLDLARSLYSNRRSYRLGSIARLLKITYDDDVAHRADYDAEILAHVFAHMLREEKLASFETVDDLNRLSDETAYAKTRKSHISVVAKNQAGLKKLYELISLSYTTYLASFGATKSAEFVAEPRIIKEEIESHRDQLLIGAGCSNSDVFETAMNKSDAHLQKAIEFYDYIEIMPLDTYRHLVERDVIESEARLVQVIQRIIAMAKRCNKLIIASGDAHYNHPKQQIVRDIYIHSQGIGGSRHPLYIYDETRRMNFKSPKQHFRPTQEMMQEFPYLSKEDVELYVITNTNLLFDQLEEIEPIPSKLFTPKLENSDELLKEIVYNTAHQTYGETLPVLVSDRIERELNSIIGHGFGVIYYISHLLVKKSLDDGYLVGSRGSVGSSLVATMAKITEVNPLPAHYICKNCQHSEFFTDGEYSSGFDLPPKTCPHCGEAMIGEGQDIPFETFLGFEGDKVPDIDLNFSGVYQEVAHAYTKEIFGEDYVYRAGTISTVAQKTAFGYVKGYYENTNQGNPSQAWATYLSFAAEGVKRTTGQHPGGIIVIPNYMDVHDFTPVQYPANNPESAWKTTHFEFHDIHDNVLKLDILGHVDPTAMKMLERLSGIDINTVPMSDPDTISLFSTPNALKVDTRTYHEKTGALGIPEFGTQFVRRMLEATRPDTFSDLVRISGLSHGTDVWKNNAETLIENGLTLKDVIGCRDDIMVYLMLHGLKPKLAFDIMESVRKGRGVNDAWKQEMKRNNIPEWYVDSCEKIKYMFPKAHAVAYVMMAIRVAWFKVHHPLTYYAVYFTLRVNAYEIETMTAPLDSVQRRLDNIRMRLKNFETKRDVSTKEQSLIDTLEVTIEMQSRGFHINPIDLMKSDATEFKLDPDDPYGIIPPFNVIDGLGDAVARTVVEARIESEFISKRDLIKRTGLSTTLLSKLDALGVTNHLQETNQLSLF